MSDLNKKNILMIIAPTDFKDEEYFIPKQIFENNKAIVKTASLTKEAISVTGKKVQVDLLLNNIIVQNFDAIIFIGGPGANIYFNNKTAHQLVKQSYDKQKIIAAICIAPSTIANAGILKGKRATAFPTQEDNLESKGATYTGDSVTVDGKIVTGKDPTAARKFGETIVNLLK